MHLDDLLAAGARVQRVDVLRDDGLDEPAALELREREVAAFGSASRSEWMRSR